VSHHRFPRTSRWRRGYHCRQVDEFLAKVEQSLQGTLPPMAAADIRRTGFELVHHGYTVALVDAHLDALEEQVLVVEAETSGRRGRSDQSSDVQFLRDQLSERYMRRFPRSRAWRRGYDVDGVDAFVDRVLARLDENADGEALQLTAEVVRTTGFKPRRGGYSEEAVDEMLDRVVEVLLVQRRAADPAV
jgi:DivIVA domain-containing protein